MALPVLTLSLAVLVGVLLGLLGGGGSILTVPLLAYVAQLPAKEAIATSLVVVGTTSAVAAVSHARAGRVQWRTGLVFGAAGMVGAYLGGRLSELFDGKVLLIIFAVVMLVAAVAMIRPRHEPDPDAVPDHLPVARTLAQGLGVGVITGLVGAGGGFLIVPALALLAGLPMQLAVGTSLVVIAMNSAAALAGYVASTRIDWTTAGLVTLAAVAGSFVGAALTSRVEPARLRRAFGFFVLAMGAFQLTKELVGF